jgi:hypothetical protein
VRHVLLIALLASCAPVPQGYRDARVPEVLVVAEHEVDGLGLEPRFLERSFASGRDSDEVMRSFLQDVRDEGSGHVSSIAIHLIVGDVEVLDCVTHIGPEEEIERRWKTVHTPGRTEYERELKPVQQTRTTYENECEHVRKPVQRMKTEYEDEYDYRTHKYERVRRTRMVTEYESKYECKSVRRTRTETVYEYQTVAKWVPPKLEVISEQHSHWKLVESAPSCAPLAPGRRPVNTIEGRIYVKPPAAAK